MISTLTPTFMSNTSPERMLQILDETVRFYSEDPSRRAVKKRPEGNITCEYFLNEARSLKMCGVGRCLLNPSHIPEGGADELWESFKFKPEYDGLNAEFWMEIQEIHDQQEYWDDAGMTTDGKFAVKEFKRKIRLKPKFYVQYKP